MCIRDSDQQARHHPEGEHARGGQVVRGRLDAREQQAEGLRAKGNLAAAGVAGVGMMTRGIAVMLVAFAVAVSDPWLGLAAALTYAFAYTIELLLSLVSYFGNEPL